MAKLHNNTRMDRVVKTERKWDGDLVKKEDCKFFVR
jgi:hypothetical protein